MRVATLFVLFTFLSPLHAYFEPKRTDWEGLMRPLEIVEWRFVYEHGANLNQSQDNSLDVILVLQHAIKDLAVGSFKVEISFNDKTTGAFLGSQAYSYNFSRTLTAGGKRTAILKLRQNENRRLFGSLRYANADTVNISLKILELKDKKGNLFPLGVL